jgi:CDK-activating kinase assembly factor MAT1
MIEKEVDIRKRVLRDFNKKEEDFSTLREYNDYLEEVETIIYNLTNNIDVIATNKKIEQYKKENKDLILKNKSKIGREEMELEELLEEEKHQEEIKKKELVRLEQEEKKKRLRDKEALIDELMFSNADAKNILETFAHNVQATKEDMKTVPIVRATQFSTGIKFSRQRQQNFLPVPKIEEGPLYVYEAPRQPTDGPLPPAWSDLEEKGYVNHVECEKDEHRAGGYRASISCLRALQEALAGLYHVSDRTELIS